MSREYGVFVHFLKVLLRTVGDVGNWYSFLIGLLWTLLVKLIDQNGHFLSHVHGYEAVRSFVPYNFLVGRSLVMSLLVGFLTVFREDRVEGDTTFIQFVLQIF